MISIRKALRINKGQTLIELTFIFPIMLALLYGAIEVGSVISDYLTITSTSREGANLTSRGTDPNTALDAIIAAAAPTIRSTNQGQWRVIYSKITQNPASPCPPKPCTYRVESQIIRGNYAQNSKLGAVGDNVTVISGIGSIDPGQTFQAVEVYYNYAPDVMTYVGSKLINTTFYDRTIFTNVSSI
jgi:Flp pilus assembly protein TadG